jgi:hypothetical protein
LAWQLGQKKTTILVASELQEKRNSLRRRIDMWQEIQSTYMPGVRQARTAAAAAAADNNNNSSNNNNDIRPDPAVASTSEQPEATCLFLPSQMPPRLWTTGCVSGLVDRERRLRVAQADDALSELKQQLRISANIRDYKISQVGGTSQKMNTRARTLMARFHDKTLRCARCYTAAFNALIVLDPGGEWSNRLQHLDHSKDIRGPRWEEDDPTEGTRELSWIWLAPQPSGCPTEVESPDEVGESKVQFIHDFFLS